MTPNQTFLHFVALYAPLFLAHQTAMEEAGYCPRLSDTSKAGYKRPPKPKTALTALYGAYDYFAAHHDAIFKDPEQEAHTYLRGYFGVSLDGDVVGG